MAESNEKQQTKLTYEQLENVCNTLQQQNQQLKMLLQRSVTEEQIKQIEFGFKVLENQKAFSQSFVQRVITILESSLFIEEIPNQETDNKE